MSEPAFLTEVLAAFRKYCEDRQPPDVTPETVGYLKHCLTKAARRAASMGEEPTIEHHQMFLLMVEDCGHPELVTDFLIALPRSADGNGNSAIVPTEGVDP